MHIRMMVCEWILDADVYG